MNCGEPQNSFHFKDRESNLKQYPEPTVEKILNQIKTLNNDKAPSEDKITEQLLKIETNNLYRLVSRLWQKEEIPKE